MIKRFIKKISAILLITGLLCGCNNLQKEAFPAKQSAMSTLSQQTLGLGAIYDSSATVDENIKNYLEQMTPGEKVGQMLQVERRTISIEDIKKYYIGSIFAAGGSTPDENTMGEWRKMIERYKEAAKETKLGIPLIYAVDAVHGNNNMEDTVIYPHNIGLGASRDAELIKKIAVDNAKELAAAGVDWTFSPTVAVSNDIRWGRTYECFSENSDLVSIMSIPYITALQENGIIACAKHYVADGAVEFGTGDSSYLMDQGDARISQKELNDYYISVYREAVNAGVKSIMVSYSSINGEKNHSNRNLLQNVLKDDIGFKGIVISDYNGIHQLDGDTIYSRVVEAVNAGVDVLMEDLSWKECYEALIKAIENREIAMERINDAVARVLRVKMEMGKFEGKNTTEQAFILRNYKSKQIAEEAVRKSLVLLKNENKVLPLDKSKKIAVIGPAADNIGVQCGGWTKTWQGGQDDINKGRWMSGTTILDGFKEIASQSGGTIITEPDKLKDADVIVSVIGEYPYAEGKGDDESLSLERGTVLEENAAALKIAYEAKKPLVVILVSGRPRIITDEIDKWDGFVEAWLPGTEGGEIAKVLYDDYEFEARLPVTWPRNYKQLPMTINNQSDGYEALFPYGYGLSIKK
ncbi:beta-glucosidase [Ruminiclostridium sufflavum DSM 19573]|uniref:beta-glucosidase n=1 Tax=Ruminiclostridium sufflavum DSM 19573 TaxID=1121337 RepID=A0A318XL86_9FIRM|nr:glycoside hydrolase family 3 N-terminal domain-containing protein [Ruminiclostridium sufflavum]PYG87143.1 beta-glucosidase [Ruminiclostridium sufflavum DSM 19573]